MAETLIFTGTKSHWDSEEEWNPAGSGQGKDTLSFTIPEGSRFARYSVEMEVASAGSGCIVESAPEQGDAGPQFIRVRWWYNPFGKIRYTVSVYAGDPETVVVYHGENNWTGKTLNAIEQGLSLNLSGRGPIAKKLFSRMMRMSGKPMPYTFYSEPELASVTVSTDISLGLVASVKYGAVGGILLFALCSGYHAGAKFNPHGMLPFDDELTIEMRKK